MNFDFYNRRIYDDTDLLRCDLKDVVQTSKRGKNRGFNLCRSMKIGIIGGYGHQCVTALPGAEFAWACDGYDHKALARAEAGGGKNAYPSPEAMLEDYRPDIVYVGSVYAHNGPLAVRALEHGYDVICEKPLATDWETLKRLHELTMSGERRIIGEFTTRWSGPFEKARELVRSGAIGEPVHIQAQKTYKFGAHRPEFYKSRASFGGIIPWVASHAIDYAAWCTGLQYVSVTALQGNRCFPEYREMEDHATMLFQMTGGVPCVVSADFLRPDGASTHGDDRLRVTGSMGVLEIRGEELFFVNAGGEQCHSFATDESQALRRARDIVRAALGALDAGISTAECLHVTAAALAARESADNAAADRGMSRIPVMR